MKYASIRKNALPFFDERFIQIQQKQTNVRSAFYSINFREKLTLFINNEGYNLFMAILTVYSIFIVDIIKSFSNLPTAFIIGYIHIIAICIFAIQMTLNWFLKEKYFLSFYFWIDVVSTISMVMEIIWVDNWLVDNSSLPAVLTIAKVVKASRLSRIGGRATKILLIFINYFKNKKNQEENELRNRQAKNTESVYGDSLFKTQSNIDNKMKMEEQIEEDQVVNLELTYQQPKKIDLKNTKLEPISQEKISQKSNESDQNTEKPKSKKSKIKSSAGSQFSLLNKRRSRITKKSQNQKKSQIIPQKKAFQIQNIVERLQQAFQKLQPIHRINVDPIKAIELQNKWQELVQRQEKAKKQSKQKIKSNKQNFKLGESLKSQIQKNIIIMIMSLIIILPLISANTWFNSDPTVDQMMDSYFAIANDLPSDQLYSYLRVIITSSFELISPIMYMKAQIGNTTYIYPQDFPDLIQPQLPLSDYMQTQKIFSMNKSNYYIIFNNRHFSQVSSIINIIRSCFITILLIFSTIIFMYSIQVHALIPLESMCISINKISINPFQALKDINQNKDDVPKINDIQTNILQKVIWKMTNLLVVGAGEQGSQLISSKIDDNKSDSSSFQTLDRSRIHGVFMYVKLSSYQAVLNTYSDNLLSYVNKISGEIHQIFIKNGAIILQNDCPYFLAFWKTPQDINIQLETTKFFTASNPLKNLGKTIQTQKIIQLALRTYLQINMNLLNLNKLKMQEGFKDKYEGLFEQFVLQAGIHIGDGFKGSIGSSLKIQIKCIGSDLQYTKNLCNLASKYGISNILSQQICEILDDHESNFIRKIDFIKQRQTGDSSWIYSYNFTLLPLIYPQKFQTQFKLKKRKTSKNKTFKPRQSRNQLYKKRNEILSRIKSQPIQSVVPLNQQQKACQKMYTFQFYNTWNEALQRYYEGQWQQATLLFEDIKKFYTNSYNDILSCMMLQRIQQLTGIDVETWSKVQMVYFQ